MSPAKIAMAAQVTMAPTAGIGSMKKVTGTSSAIAMVAVRPGTAPTNMPNMAAKKTVSRTSHWKTSSKACSSAFIASPPADGSENAPGKRHVEQAAEDVEDAERGDPGDDDAHDPADIEQPQQDESSGPMVKRKPSLREKRM
jgi:hypothetical protein